ncbi:STM3941 family protein [Polaribacter sp. M15]|jgi:hypothetical protein
MKEKIEIPKSKKKIIWIILGSILLTIGSYRMFIEPEPTLIYRRGGYFMKIKSEEIIKILGLLGIIFFGIINALGIKKLFEKKAGIIINKKGIIDNSSFFKIGLIEWENIISIKKRSVNSIDFLQIIVKNPEFYIKKNNILSKLIMKLNLKLYETPINFSSNSIKMNFQELEDLIQTELKRNKNVR